MKKTLEVVLILSIAASITACKLAVIVVEGGKVQSVGSGVCLAGSICIIDVMDPSFSETFTAIPETDWYFEKWNSGHGFFCGDSTDPTCILSFAGHEQSESVADMVASSETFYLLPIFKMQNPITDTLTVNGKVWAQADLFLSLSWEQINAACPVPTGVCSDKAILNGYDMTGWTWASVKEAKELFNGYIGDDILGPENDYYQDTTGESVARFYESGWRPTFDGEDREFLVTTWHVMLRDSESIDNGRTDVGRALVFLERDGDGNFESAGFSANIRGSKSGHYRVGAAFYR